MKEARSGCQNWLLLSEQTLTCSQIALHVYQVNEANQHRQNWEDPESNVIFSDVTRLYIASHFPSATSQFFSCPSETEL